MVEIDSRPGGDRHSPKHVCQLSLAPRPQHRDHLQLGHACRQAFADNTVEKDIGRVAENLGAEDRKGHARGRH